MHYAVSPIDDPKAGSNDQRLKVQLLYPNRYRVMVIPLRDGVEEERREWWVSNGKLIWHAEREFADEEADVDKPKPVADGKDDVGGFVKMLRMDRAEIDKRFVMQARPVTAADTGVHKETAHLVDLTPKTPNWQNILRKWLFRSDLICGRVEW